jgi:hypothetical protein
MSGMRQGCPLFPLTQHSPGIPSQSNKAKEEIKGIQLIKEVVKLSLFADDIILYLKDPEKHYPKPPRHQK